MSQPNIIDNAVDKIKHYISIRTELFTLKIVQHIATASGMLIWIFLVSSCIVMTILLSSVGLALYLSDNNSHWHQGFFMVSLFYLLISIIILIIRRKISKMITNKVIDNIINDDDDDDNIQH